MWSSFVFALQFLTRIHIADLEWDYKKYGQGSSFFPAVGFIIGGFLYVTAFIGLKFFTPLIVAALLIVIGVVITGGLHLDGFMDSIDGLFCGRSLERKLEIMKDSRVGSFGVIGLVCLFLIKLCFTVELLNIGKIGWLFAVPVFARWCIVYSIRHFPYLRQSGLGNPCSDHTGKKEFLTASVITAVILLVVMSTEVLVFLLLIPVNHFFAKWVNRTLGGLTGDIYGATTEIMEVMGLIGVYLAYTTSFFY
ncbi:adenosylcobinamide-GDP ribazoletransferase [Phosphitispora sp. TUW77]|uniref:adenosylcobinamide-GDP ribazoletransferase n=1 Tax=Phosphitispora sp. TUW77 TaxID=3152361 RepID=UPI003AB6BE0F